MVQERKQKLYTHQAALDAHQPMLSKSAMVGWKRTGKYIPKCKVRLIPISICMNLMYMNKQVIFWEKVTSACLYE